MPEVAHLPKTRYRAGAFPAPPPRTRARGAAGSPLGTQGSAATSGGSLTRQRMRTDHLVQEGVRREPQTEDRDPQDTLSREDDVVLPRRVVDGAQGKSMVSTVDLDDEPNLLPGHVKVDPAT